MKLKKSLSILLAFVLIASAAAIALAESADVSAEETAAIETYSFDEMLTQAMVDAYARQAAYNAYTEAFTDSKSITGFSVDSQIVLLEMLLKANDVAMPAANMDVTVPETKADAYQAIAKAESNTVSMMKTYLVQEVLKEDAQLVFRSVRNSSYKNAVSFARMARVAERTQQMTELFSNENAKVIVIQGSTGPYSVYGRPIRGRGCRIMYIYTANPTDTQVDDAQDSTDPATEDSVSD